jgi:hypothetical protein
MMPLDSAFHRSEIYMLVGRSSNGYWVAQTNDGSLGGIFAKRSQAIRFAADEKAEIIDVPALELDFHQMGPLKKERVL